MNIIGLLEDYSIVFRFENNSFDGNKGHTIDFYRLIFKIPRKRCSIIRSFHVMNEL